MTTKLTFRALLQELQKMTERQLEQEIIVLPVSAQDKNYINIEGDSCLDNSIEITFADSDIVHKSGICAGTDISGIYAVSSLKKEGVIVGKVTNMDSSENEFDEQYCEDEVIVEKGMPYIRFVDNQTE